MNTCDRCLELLRQLAADLGGHVNVASVFTFDGTGRVWLNDDFLDSMVEARAHLLEHATEPKTHFHLGYGECDRKPEPKRCPDHGAPDVGNGKHYECACPIP